MSAKKKDTVVNDEPIELDFVPEEIVIKPSKEIKKEVVDNEQ